MQRWEYRTLIFGTHGFLNGGKVDGLELSEVLNRLGEQGWELVSTMASNAGQGWTREVVAILKRPLEERND